MIGVNSQHKCIWKSLKNKNETPNSSVLLHIQTVSCWWSNSQNSIHLREVSLSSSSSSSRHNKRSSPQTLFFHHHHRQLSSTCPARINRQMLCAMMHRELMMRTLDPARCHSLPWRLRNIQTRKQSFAGAFFFCNTQQSFFCFRSLYQATDQFWEDTHTHTHTHSQQSKSKV